MPKNTCYFCDVAAPSRVEWEGGMRWVCERHRRRLERTGTPHILTHRAVSDDDLRRIVHAYHVRGLTYRAAAVYLGISGTSVGAGLRRWRLRCATQRDEERMTLRESALYWQVPEPLVRRALDRFDREGGWQVERRL